MFTFKTDFVVTKIESDGTINRCINILNLKTTINNHFLVWI